MANYKPIVIYASPELHEFINRRRGLLSAGKYVLHKSGLAEEFERYKQRSSIVDTTTFNSDSDRRSSIHFD
jgi:hypothetical protein